MPAGFNILFALTILASLGCGLVAGLFFAFSVSVMRGLARLPAAEGIAAMQSINLAIINPWFLGVFFGTAVLCLALAGSAMWGWHQPGAGYLLVGSLLYLIGTILVTIFFNVPMNDALASVAATSTDSAGLWVDYLARWTAWNHVRTIAALAATASIVIGLYRST